MTKGDRSAAPAFRSWLCAVSRRVHACHEISFEGNVALVTAKSACKLVRLRGLQVLAETGGLSLFAGAPADGGPFSDVRCCKSQRLRSCCRSRRSAPSIVRTAAKMGGEPVRLHVRGQILGYKRSKANQHNHTALIKVCPLFSRGSAPATSAQLWLQLHLLERLTRTYMHLLVILLTDMPGQTRG
jgi:hypothetical protein